MAAMRVDLNADFGESFGIYTMGDDEALIGHLTTVNIACGYHAGDPATIRRSVQLARRFGVGIGAHVSYPDIVGFGRHKMSLSEDEVCDITVHQIGALLGFCRAEKSTLQHVKPHGQLYLTAERDRATARGIVRAMASIDKELILLLAGPIVAEECERAGVRMAHEAFIDLDYDPGGQLMLVNKKAPRDPALMAKRALGLVREQRVQASDGSWLSVPTQSICIHGDGPNAVEIAATVREALKSENIEIVTLLEVLETGSPGRASRSG